MANMSEVTLLLSQIEKGDQAASEQLLPLVYEELRRLAQHYLAHEKPGQTLQATALVHEAYLRLVGDSHQPGWDSRGHFFAAAAEAMRRILVDSARQKLALKRGGDRHRVDLPNDVADANDQNIRILAVNDALTRLADEDPQLAELVKLRFFAGLSLTEAAMVVGISRSTAYEQWKYVRAWLQCELAE